MRGRFQFITLGGVLIGAVYMLRSLVDYDIPQIGVRHATMAIAFVVVAFALAHALERLSGSD